MNYVSFATKTFNINFKNLVRNISARGENRIENRALSRGLKC